MLPPPRTLLSFASTHGATAAPQAVGGKARKVRPHPCREDSCFKHRKRKEGKRGTLPFPQSLVASRPLLQEAPPPSYLRRFSAQPQ